jgi:hypothetical protein
MKFAAKIKEAGHGLYSALAAGYSDSDSSYHLLAARLHLNDNSPHSR